MEHTPRISGKMMESFVGRMIYIICDVSSATRDQAGNQVIRSTDGIDIIAQLPAGERFESQRFVQLFGRVIGSKNLQVIEMTSAGDDLDVPQYNTALGLMHGKYQNLFSAAY